MRGWTPDGKEIELAARQEEAVRKLMAWARGEGPLELPEMGKQAGKSVVLATVARLDQAANAGIPAAGAMAEFRRALILAVNDPDCERAVHQAVARVQARRKTIATGTLSKAPPLRSVGAGG